MPEEHEGESLIPGFELEENPEPSPLEWRAALLVHELVEGREGEPRDILENRELLDRFEREHGSTRALRLLHNRRGRNYIIEEVWKPYREAIESGEEPGSYLTQTYEKVH